MNLMGRAYTKVLDEGSCRRFGTGVRDGSTRTIGTNVRRTIAENLGREPSSRTTAIQIAAPLTGSVAAARSRRARSARRFAGASLRAHCARQSRVGVARPSTRARRRDRPPPAAAQHRRTTAERPPQSAAAPPNRRLGTRAVRPVHRGILTQIADDAPQRVGVASRIFVGAEDEIDLAANRGSVRNRQVASACGS